MNDSPTRVHTYIEKIMPQLEKTAGGKILYPYLSVGCGEHYAGVVFCWDHYHMGIRFAKAGKPEYQKYLVDNLLAYQTRDGFTPNCLSAEGPYGYFPPFHAQPFLMQAALMYVNQTGDIAWAKNQYESLKKYLHFYETDLLAPQGLFRWPLSWMSGFDNDVVTTFFQPETVIPADINAWLFLEYQASAHLAKKLNCHSESDSFTAKAEQLRDAINQVLWYDKVDSYSAFNLSSQQPLFHFVDKYLNETIGYYAFQSCSNLIPLYAGIPDQDRAKRMIEKYVLNEKHFLSPFGIRSLSKSSEYYNNAMWGNPSRFGSHLRLTNSNWQGPVWIPLNYFMCQAISHYGFEHESKDLADRTHSLLASSINSIGSFTENYHADTGQPLYAPTFASWNILADLMYERDENHFTNLNTPD